MIRYFVSHRGVVVSRDALLNGVRATERRTRGPWIPTSSNCDRRSKRIPHAEAVRRCTVSATSSSGERARRDASVLRQHHIL